MRCAVLNELLAGIASCAVIFYSPFVTGACDEKIYQDRPPNRTCEWRAGSQNAGVDLWRGSIVMLGIIAMMLALGQAAPVVTDIESATFVPLDPAQPNGTRIAVLKGDPATGPSDMLMTFGRANGVLHVHSSDYRLVIVRGTMTHSAKGGESLAKPMGPGSYWFQPGGQPHTDSCLSDECVMFISWSGPRDSRPAPR